MRPSVTFGLVDIATLLSVTVGPLKALIVFATLTARADADLRRQVAIRTVTVATVVTPGVRGRVAGVCSVADAMMEYAARSAKTS